MLAPGEPQRAGLTDRGDDLVQLRFGEGGDVDFGLRRSFQEPHLLLHQQRLFLATIVPTLLQRDLALEPLDRGATRRNRRLELHDLRENGLLPLQR
jgi:hypothetical protein